MTDSAPWKLSATDIAALVRSRKVSAVEVARSALARLETANPALNAVVERLLVLNFGKVIGVGEPQAIMASREVREIYLGIEI